MKNRLICLLTLACMETSAALLCKNQAYAWPPDEKHGLQTPAIGEPFPRCPLAESLGIVEPDRKSQIRPAQKVTVLIAKRTVFGPINDPTTMFENSIIFAALSPQGAIQDVELLRSRMTRFELQAGDIVTTDHLLPVGCGHRPDGFSPLWGNNRKYGVRVSANEDVRPNTRVNVVLISNDDGSHQILLTGVRVVETQVFHETNAQYVTLSVRLDDVLPLALAETKGRLHLRPADHK